MTRDSDRHAQRGDAKQAPSEGCQSGGATSAASPNLHPTKKGDTVEELSHAEWLRQKAHQLRLIGSRPLDADFSVALTDGLERIANRISSPEVVTVTELCALLRELRPLITVGGVTWKDVKLARERIDAALSKLSPLVQGGQSGRI